MGTQKLLKIMGKKIFTIDTENFCSSKPVWIYTFFKKMTNLGFIKTRFNNQPAHICRGLNDIDTVNKY